MQEGVVMGPRECRQSAKGRSIELNKNREKTAGNIREHKEKS